jgi:serine/threonine protein kinase
VLFDFGLASIWRINTDEGVCESRPLTGETGALRYMAPEVALSKPYNHKAEVFSWALVVFEMSAHEKPFENLSSENFGAVIGRGDRPAIRAKWPPSLRALLAECWHAEPNKRPEFRELAPLLDAAIAEQEEADTRAVQKKEEGGGCLCIVM